VDEQQAHRGGSGGSAAAKRITVRRAAGLLAVAALTAAALAACGGPGSTARGTSGRTTAQSSASGSAGPAGSGALLSAVLGNPSSVQSVSLASTPAGRAASAPSVATGLRRCVATARSLRASGRLFAARAVWHACLRHYLRLRFGIFAAMHGQITVTTRQGTRTLAFERGVISSVSGSAMVVRAADGTTWTWDLTAATLVRQAGAWIGTKTLRSGQQVFVAGPVTGGSYDARRIAVRA
jgi:Domain of unknown function (DUF5666)